LTAVMAHLESMPIDRVLCLGDLVGYHADHDACVQLLRAKGVITLRGNHDRAAVGAIEPYDFSKSARHAVLWTRRTMSQETRDFLASLPTLMSLDDCVLVHAGLYPVPNDKTRIANRGVAERHLDALVNEGYPANVCFFGHTHKAIAYERAGEATVTRQTSHLQLEDGAHYLVNPGTVGQPRDGDRDASFAVFDTAARTIAWHAVAFDFRKTLEKAERAGALVNPAEPGSLAPRPARLERARRLATRVRRFARVVLSDAKGILREP
ncbi:MAG TPA: metallophosphoesterase family protein, partial [Polyangiaceae bacterium]